MRIRNLAELEKIVGKELTEQYAPYANFPKKSKYNNKKTIFDNITFDSQAEAEYYATLKRDQKHLNIESIELQPKFTLIPNFTTLNGKRIRACTYTADFKIIYLNGLTEIVDVKGFETLQYKDKRKQFLYRYEKDNFRFVEIIKGVRKEY